MFRPNWETKHKVFKCIMFYDHEKKHDAKTFARTKYSFALN